MGLTTAQENLITPPLKIKVRRIAFFPFPCLSALSPWRPGYRQFRESRIIKFTVVSGCISMCQIQFASAWLKASSHISSQQRENYEANSTCVSRRSGRPCCVCSSFSESWLHYRSVVPPPIERAASSAVGIAAAKIEMQATRLLFPDKTSHAIP